MFSVKPMSPFRTKLPPITLHTVSDPSVCPYHGTIIIIIISTMHSLCMKNTFILNASYSVQSYRASSSTTELSCCGSWFLSLMYICMKNRLMVCLPCFALYCALPAFSCLGWRFVFILPILLLRTQIHKYVRTFAFAVCCSIIGLWSLGILYCECCRVELSSVQFSRIQFSLFSSVHIVYS